MYNTMSCFGDDGYYRSGSCYGYGQAFGFGPGYGSYHNGFRPQSCCSGGLGSTGPHWGFRPCGIAGGNAGCCNPYGFGTVVTNVGCGFGVNARGAGISTGPYLSPCAPYTIC